MPNQQSKPSFLIWFQQGFIQGIAWSLGATLGFAIVSYFLIFILRAAGGLPIVGVFIASIVESTQSALAR